MQCGLKGLGWAVVRVLGCVLAGGGGGGGGGGPCVFHVESVQQDATHATHGKHVGRGMLGVESDGAGNGQVERHERAGDVAQDMVGCRWCGRIPCLFGELHQRKTSFVVAKHLDPAVGGRGDRKRVAGWAVVIWAERQHGTLSLGASFFSKFRPSAPDKTRQIK